MVGEDTEGGEDESNAKQSENADSVQARFSELNNLTRAELAAVKLPGVVFISENDVSILLPQLQQ